MLFRSIESGATLKLVEPEQGARVARELLKNLGLEAAKWRDLQNVPLDKLMSAYFATQRSMNVDQMTMGFSPNVDGTAIPTHPFHPQASPVSADVPLMLGSTRTELTSSAEAAAFALDDAGLRARVGEMFREKASRILSVYRDANPGASPSDLYFLIASDERYSAPVMKIAERRAALAKGPVYLYYFRWETPLDGGKYKAPHTVEIPFAFHNLDASPWTSGVPGIEGLADQVSDAWLAFARGGNPNAPKVPQWPAFDAQRRATMVFDTKSAVADDPLRAQRIAMFEAKGLT